MAFILWEALALVDHAVFWWLIVMGLAAGTGFFWALPGEKTAKNRHKNKTL